MVQEENPYSPPEAAVDVDDGNDILASRGARLGGAIIDSILSIVVIIPIMFMTGYWQRAATGEISWTEALGYGLLGIFIFIVLHGYLLAKRGQTIGKVVAETRIVSVDDGKILPFSRVLGLRYLPWFVISQIPLIGPILGLVNVLFIFRSDKRCLHDLIAGTRVIRA